MKNFQEFVKSCSKDEESYKKLIGFVEELVEEREEVKNQLNLLERAIRSDYDSIVITTLELDEPGPEIVYVNDGFTRMTGFSKEEAIGNTPRILQGPKTDQEVLDTLKKRLKEGKSFFGHTVNYRKDGSEFINQWDIHPLTDENGEITHWVSYQHDITERKRSEKKVVDSRIEFDKLDEESKKTLVDIDEQGNILTSNKAFRDLLGFENEELKKRKIWDLLVDKDVESFKKRFDSFKPSDFEGASHDVSLKNRMGNAVEVKLNSRLMEIEGQPVVRASIENRSLQKKIAAMLSRHQDSYEKMFDTMRDYRYKIKKNDDGDFAFKFVSDTFSAITGISVDAAGQMLVRDLVHEDDAEKVEAHLNRVLEGKPNTEQFRIRKNDGNYIEVIDYAKPVWNPDQSSVEEIKGATSTEISAKAE